MENDNSQVTTVYGNITELVKNKFFSIILRIIVLVVFCFLCFIGLVAKFVYPNGIPTPVKNDMEPLFEKLRPFADFFD